MDDRVVNIIDLRFQELEFAPIYRPPVLGCPDTYIYRAQVLGCPDTYIYRPQVLGCPDTYPCPGIQFDVNVPDYMYSVKIGSHNMVDIVLKWR